MQQLLNPKKTAVAVGLFFGGWHIVLSALVALGWAQPLADFAMNMHFIKPFVQFQSFDLSQAVFLSALAACVSGIAGFVFAHIWNWVHKK